MGLGTGIDCKYCGKQIYMDDSNADEQEKICGQCMAMKKIIQERQEDAKIRGIQ